MLRGLGNDAVVELPDGTAFRFGLGPGTETHQDDWCVFIVDPDGAERIPKDVHYFADLKVLGERHGAWRIYKTFLQVYDSTTEDVELGVLEHITEMAETFGDDELLFQRTMVTLYLAMIAEENKRPEWRWPMKKTVKKLGVYELLMLGFTPLSAANSSKRPETKDTNRARLEVYEVEERRRLADEAAVDREIRAALDNYEENFAPYLDD